MKSKKQVVTITDIKKSFQKNNIRDIIFFTILFLLFTWETFTANGKELAIVALLFCLSFLFGIGRCLYNIVKIQKNTYFHIKTDVLVNKADDIHTFLYGHETHRLYFRQGHYDMRVYGRSCGPDGVWYTIYDMGSKTIYNTAFAGDSFTLVCVGKRVHLAFNNKLFDIQNDL